MSTPANAGRAPRSSRVRRTIAAVLLGTTVLTGPFLIANHSTAAAAESALTQNMPGSFADLATKVSPAVVNVSTTQQAKAERGAPRMPGFPPGSPFEEFFRQFQDQFGQNGGPGGGPGGGSDDESEGQPRGKVGSLGSGFIIDAAGYVVTNNHVIDGADEIKVTLQDGTELPATLVGRDAKTDIALLKVTSDKALPALDWGDSDAARVGDWVMAVGNPFGLGGTVTKGIISARGRDIHSGPYDDYLQLDAAINRGNSGGPTFTLDGRVIGINTAIYSPNGGSVGIGFAIPSNIAKQVVAQLKENGHVERGWLGVKIQEISPEIAESVGLSQTKGALVAEVTPDSPAAKAGVRQGDVILAYGGKPVNTLRDLTRRVADTKAGDTVDMTVVRKGKETTLTAHIAPLPAEQRMAAAEGTGPAADSAVETVKGLKLAPLDGAARSRLGLGEGVKGVVVTAVSQQAGDLPVRPGDVIVKVGDHNVTSPAEVTKSLHEAEKDGRKAVLLLVNRGGNESFVPLKLGKA
ncbi:Do family serine endopeptidase [Azospirillum formosense]|uniref:Probable periplasmic serine endoprotease DegP-like n=1 Tax=Azospirillum formosense TaxID=861533 RepID=A0ABX2KSJ7_9PROT|nr:DegQ family serine endoprotease [Azospirillum formosense]MBY3753450.1 DegQ family serine endoprotease [Azospirillum formosense]NUB18657.1 Do family serine endopeptidase [Azospirillum formosense]